MARGGMFSFAIPLYAPSRHEVDEGGQILFQSFVREEFENEGLSSFVLEDLPDRSGTVGSEDDDSLHFRQEARSEYRSAESQGVGTPDGYKNDVWSCFGRDLRKLADEFSQSKQAKEVRKKAEGVTLSKISKEGFFNLCCELFKEGISTERILALFCFCSTLLIRSVRENVSSLTRFLFDWSVEFIRGQICQWVYEHGGWGKVLGTFYNVVFRIAVVGLMCVGIFAGCVYIKKHL